MPAGVLASRLRRSTCWIHARDGHKTHHAHSQPVSIAPCMPSAFRSSSRVSAPTFLFSHLAGSATVCIGVPCARGPHAWAMWRELYRVPTRHLDLRGRPLHATRPNAAVSQTTGAMEVDILPLLRERVSPPHPRLFCQADLARVLRDTHIYYESVIRPQHAHQRPTHDILLV